MMSKIEDYLDELFPNPKCELNYSKDYELLIATVLSAQSTDRQVNKVTSVLFEKYSSLKKLENADIVELENSFNVALAQHNADMDIEGMGKEL